jgi:hypothetical protein
LLSPPPKPNTRFHKLRFFLGVSVVSPAGEGSAGATDGAVVPAVLAAAGGEPA